MSSQRARPETISNTIIDLAVRDVRLLSTPALLTLSAPGDGESRASVRGHDSTILRLNLLHIKLSIRALQPKLSGGDTCLGYRDEKEDQRRRARARVPHGT